MSEATPDPDGEAVEFVLGTLSRSEREAAERRLGRDAPFAASVRFWREKLASLDDAADPLAPTPELWTRIEKSIAAAGPDASGDPARVSGRLLAVQRSRSRWRNAAVAASALAASLAFVVAIDRRPAGPATAERLVAVVNRSGELPALIVHVDQAAGTVQVRSLGAETPPGHALELWSIVGNETPHSLGALGPGGGRRLIPDHDRPRLVGATIAVTVEPPGGSASGRPTGPVVYTGRLVPERGEP